MNCEQIIGGGWELMNTTERSLIVRRVVDKALLLVVARATITLLRHQHYPGGHWLLGGRVSLVSALSPCQSLLHLAQVNQHSPGDTTLEQRLRFNSCWSKNIPEINRG